MKPTINNPSRAWLVQANVIFAEGVLSVIDNLEDMACTGHFTSVEAAFTALDESPPPDVILLDMQLPGIDGIAALGSFRERAPEAKVIILTLFDGADKIFRAVAAGASGFILKSAGIERIGDSIRQVMAGGASMTPAVAMKLLDAFTRTEHPRAGAVEYHLTPREREILGLLADGLAKKAIADVLSLGVSTVSTHLERIYAKLQVRTNTGAVAKALRENVI